MDLVKKLAELWKAVEPITLGQRLQRDTFAYKI